MSEEARHEFPMPKAIGGSPPQNYPYAPKPQPSRSTTEAIEDALKEPTAPRFEMTRVKGSIDKIDEIKALMRLLLHREMRDLVKGVFDAYAKLPRTEGGPREPAIKATELADVLDKYAFGD